MPKRKSQRGKRTAERLTTRVCKAARHSGAAYTTSDGREAPAREILWDADVRGLGLRLHPSGRKSWVLRFTRRGRTSLRDLGDFPAVPLDGPNDPRHPSARKLAQRALANLAAGLDPVPDRAKGRTVASLRDEFLEAAADRGVKASTLAKYSETLRLLDDELGAVLVDELDTARVAAAHRAWKRDRGVSAAGKALLVLRMLLKLATRTGIRSRALPDPTEEIQPPKPTKRGVKFSAEDFRRIAEALDLEAAVRPVYRDAVTAIRLLALTGCRRREITELRWSEVDLQGHRLRLVDSKTGPREIALSAPALAIFASMERGEPGSRVFPSGNGRHRVEFAVQHVWKRVRIAAGLPAEARLHDLRHSFVTWGLGADYSEALVGKAVGHSTPATTRRYSHLDLDPVREVAERIGGDIDSAMRGASVADVKSIAERRKGG